MQTTRLRRIGNTITVELPAAVLEALHLQEEDEVKIEVAGDHILLTPAPSDVQAAWSAYQELEPRYQNANRKLSE